MVGTKTCTKCQQTKPVSSFHRSKRHANGLFPYCKECRRAYNKRYVTENAGYFQQYNKQYYEKHQEHLQTQARTRARVNRVERRVKHRAYKQTNPGKFSAYQAKRRAQKLLATPAWLSAADLQEIQRVYETCPSTHHVDHIVPLQGKQVCGLHVLWNLQQIPAHENHAKNNRLEIEDGAEATEGHQARTACS